MRNLFFLLILLSSCANAEGVMQFSIAPKNKESEIMRLAVLNGQYEIYANGELDSMASERFEQFVNDNSIRDAIVVFDSPGGSLISSIKLGKAIRAHHFDTDIGTLGKNGRRAHAGMCASSCAYAFAGGVYRYFNGKDEMLGIHQFYNTKNNNLGNIGDIQAISSMIVQYLQSMGVDSNTFVIAANTSSDQMFWLTPEQASKLGLVNNGVDPTTLEIKLAGLNSYIKIEQFRKNAGARVLIFCNTAGKLMMLAGIVTNPETSAQRIGIVNRNYIETTSNSEMLVSQGNQDMSVSGSVLWLMRVLDNSDFYSIANTKTIGIWTENGSDFRWGAILDMGPVREKLVNFEKNVNGCKSTPK